MSFGVLKRASWIYELDLAKEFEGVLVFINPEFAVLVQAGVKMCYNA